MSCKILVSATYFNSIVVSSAFNFKLVVLLLLPIICCCVRVFGFVGPTGVYLLDFFWFGILFYLLLSPYLCFISLLYLDLYVLEDDELIS